MFLESPVSGFWSPDNSRQETVDRQTEIPKKLLTENLIVSVCYSILILISSLLLFSLQIHPRLQYRAHLGLVIPCAKASKLV